MVVLHWRFYFSGWMMVMLSAEMMRPRLASRARAGPAAPPLPTGDRLRCRRGRRKHFCTALAADFAG